MNTVPSIFGTAIVAMLCVALSFPAQGQSSQAGHPYASDSSMMAMSGPHPLSAADALKRLQAAGYKVAGPLTLVGLSWQAVPSGATKALRVDALTGAVSEPLKSPPDTQTMRDQNPK